MKRKIIALILAVLMITAMLPIMTVTSSAASELLGEGMAFKKESLYEMYNNLTVREDLTIESEIWIDPTSASRGGVILSNYIENGREAVPAKRYCLEIYTNGKVRFWTDDIGAYLFDFDVRTVTADGQFANIAVTVDVFAEPVENVYGTVTLYVNGIQRGDAKNITNKKLCPRMVYYRCSALRRQ